MHYTRTRFRHSQPKFPCRLGGKFLYDGARTWLTDATGALELRGDFSECANGDWILVEGLHLDGESVVCGHVEISHRPANFQGGPRGAEQVLRFNTFLRAVRAFFLERGLTEMQTPTLVRCPGLEPSLEAFAVEVTKGRDARRAYLPTSPEMHLKKALALGHTDIFEIKSCFRKGEFSEHHENEFFMLEWYRAFADLKLIAEDLQALLDHLAESKPLMRETSWRELFARELHFELTPTTTADELRALARAHGVHEIAGDTFNDLFNRLVIDKIEPTFAPRGPLLVRDFPPSQAALAKLTGEGWADRFELYWNGLEIANAFNEVNDPESQRQRWRAELAERRHLGTAELPVDEGLLEAMERHGFPPTGGIALGVERLYMAIYGVGEIEKLKLFPSVDLFKARL